MKRKIFFLTLCTFISSSLALAQSDYNSDALKKHSDEMMIEEYERFAQERQAQKNHVVDKSLPINFGQVEDVWQRHAQRRPYNGTITSSLPLDPAYSSAFSPQKKKPVVRARTEKIRTSKKKNLPKEQKAETTTAPTATTDLLNNTLPTARPTGPMTIQKPQNQQSETSQDESGLKTQTDIDSNLNNPGLTAEEALAAEEAALQILRTSDNTINALEQLFKDNPKMQDEVRRLRLSQEASIEDELNLPKPEYIEIVN